jgi:nitrous oxidase accessory protein NosD
VIVEGFAFRHMLDAGIVFWTGSGHGAALNNVVWGSRQGIRVNGATDILLAGNTLFRNENSGVYFLNASFRGAVVGNILYENAKGARWSSQSNAALAVDNVSFDNREAGISIESVTGAVLLRNRLVRNRESQLLAHRSAYVSEGDCLEDADAAPRASQPGPCGAAPEKIDVGELHARSSAYAEAASRERSAPD